MDNNNSTHQNKDFKDLEIVFRRLKPLSLYIAKTRSYNLLNRKRPNLPIHLLLPRNRPQKIPHPPRKQQPHNHNKQQQTLQHPLKTTHNLRQTKQIRTSMPTLHPSLAPIKLPTHHQTRP